MYPFVLAALIATFVAVVAIALGLIVVYDQHGVTPRQFWANLREPYRLRAFRRAHPRDYAAYHDLGFWRHTDMADLYARGWNHRTLTYLADIVRDTRFFCRTAAAPIRNDCPCRGCLGVDNRWTVHRIMAALSGTAYVLYEDVLAEMPERNDPLELQRRYDACGDLAPLTVIAGLTEAEAADLASQGRLDRESLAAMAALRGVTVRGPVQPC